MHILIVNDDGPPSETASPYISTFIHALRTQTNHTLSIVLPSTQKSWIGKALLVGQTLTPIYYNAITGATSPHPTFPTPTKQDEEDWILIDGTPASCTQLGLHHLFPWKPPVDLVLSGPNYGRNTTAVFALSSGTLGGALEGAVCGFKGIALSYAFFSQVHDQEVIKEASELSVRIVDRLWKDWGEDVGVYSINVPLKAGVSKKPICWTSMLQNVWGQASCFDEIKEDDVETPDAAEKEIREQKIGALSGHAKGRSFRWAPKFGSVYKSVEDAGPGSDGWAVKEGCTSITPIKANFMHVPGFTGELKLSPQCNQLYAMVAYGDEYVQPLLLSTLSQYLPDGSYDLIGSFDQVPCPTSNCLQFLPYELIDFEHVLLHPNTSLTSAYIIRKALIRKNYLSSLIQHWVAKHPSSCLKHHVKTTEAFEVDYAEFLDDALVDCWDLKESWARSQHKTDEQREWWILKPGMSDKGQGIKLFSSAEELQEIFDRWEEESPDSEEELEDGSNDDADVSADSKNDGFIMTSHLRHFVVQRYIHPPLLFYSRKFHVRAYVLCVGSMRVYVSREMLALFASHPYAAPWKDAPTTSYLTNTCLQDATTSEANVKRFWDIPSVTNPKQDATPRYDWKESVFHQICQVIGETFRAAALTAVTDFQPIPNAFEIFGVDFLIDADEKAWLLEFNAFPDFRQTGETLRDLVIGNLMKGVVNLAIAAFFNRGPLKPVDGMLEVLHIDLGKS